MSKETIMRSLLSCQEEWQEYVDTYQYSVIASLIFTTMCVAIFRSLKSRLEGAPGLTAQFFFVTGSLKILVAIAILTIFVPRYPERCVQPGGNPSIAQYYAYPVLALLVGLLWIRKGYERLRHAREVLGDPQGAENEAVFDKVSTVELA